MWYRPRACLVNHVEHLCQFFKQLQRGRLQFRDPPPVRSWSTLCFAIFKTHFQTFTIKLVDETFAGCRKVFTERSLKFLQGWVRNSYILKIGIQASSMSPCTCSALPVCVPSSRCTTTIFPMSTSLHLLHAALSSVRSQFPVVFVCLRRLLPQVSCQATQLLQGWKATVLPYNLPACVMQQRCFGQPAFFHQVHHIPSPGPLAG